MQVFLLLKTHKIIPELLTFAPAIKSAPESDAFRGLP